MRIINREFIESLNPCDRGLYNYLDHHRHFEGSLAEFLELKHISHNDKLWVALRVINRFSLECFSIDCAIRAAEYAKSAESAESAGSAAWYARSAAGAAARYAAGAAARYAAESAEYASWAAAESAARYARSVERRDQIESLIWLYENEDN